MSGRKLVLVALTFACLAGVGFSLELASTEEESGVPAWRLPNALQEISGLALLPDGRLATMTDESGVVHAFSHPSGEIDLLIEVGPPGDYEGIEFLNQRLYLITSEGELWFSALDGSARGHLDTGLQETCEVEGLHSDEDQLLVLCKKPYQKLQKDRLLVFTFDPGNGVLAPYLDLPNADGLRPSGISSDAAYLYIIAAKQKTLLVMDHEGTEKSRHHLKGHRQAEGIAILPDGRIAIADEGKKKGGIISLYPGLTDIGE